jgi:hypothetical protein
MSSKRVSLTTICSCSTNIGATFFFEFLRICEDIKMKKPNFKVTFGPVLRTGNTVDDLGKMGIDPKKKVAPILVLQEHIVVNDTRLLKNHCFKYWTICFYIL